MTRDQKWGGGELGMCVPVCQIIIIIIIICRPIPELSREDDPISLDLMILWLIQGHSARGFNI